jgi:hypothetical protein
VFNGLAPLLDGLSGDKLDQLHLVIRYGDQRILFHSIMKFDEISNARQRLSNASVCSSEETEASLCCESM